jgi:hypothetical protein
MDASFGSVVRLSIVLVGKTLEITVHTRYGKIALHRVQADIFEHACPLSAWQNQHADSWSAPGYLPWPLGHCQGGMPQGITNALKSTTGTVVSVADNAHCLYLGKARAFWKSFEIRAQLVFAEIVFHLYSIRTAQVLQKSCKEAHFFLPFAYEKLRLGDFPGSVRH